MSQDALFKARKIVGSRKTIAKELRINSKMVDYWFSRHVKVRVEHALMLEVLTNQKVFAEDLAPYAKEHIVAYKKFILERKS